MNGPQRLIVIVGLVVVAAIGFVVLKATGSSSTSDQPSDQSVIAPTTATTGDRPAQNERPRPKPAIPKIEVRGGEPVGGIKKLIYRKGETIEFAVVADAADELHLHGYDLTAELAPGRAATMRLEATIEGIFELELHGAHTQIASITVEP